jgi:hypothetical protein
MEAELRFKIPEESSEFVLASWGHRYWETLCNIREVLRKHTKYGVSEADTIVAIQAVLNEINPLMEEVR